MRLNAEYMQIVIAVDDSFKVKKRVGKRVAVLNYYAVFAVGIDDLVGFHRPNKNNVSGCEGIQFIVDAEDILISASNNDYLSVGMAV